MKWAHSKHRNTISRTSKCRVVLALLSISALIWRLMQVGPNALSMSSARDRLSNLGSAARLGGGERSGHPPETFEFPRERMVGSGNFGPKSLGSAQFQETFNVYCIRCVKEEPQDLDYVTTVVFQKASPGISQVLQRRIPTGTVIKEEFYSFDGTSFLILIHSV